MGFLIELIKCCITIAQQANQADQNGQQSTDTGAHQGEEQVQMTHEENEGGQMSQEEYEAAQMLANARIQRQLEYSRQLAYQIATGNIHPHAYGDYTRG